MAGSSSLVDSLFQRSLDDVVKSLRSLPPSGEPAAISRFLDEIRREIRHPDPSTKSAALAKLTYLASIHHLDPSFAAFTALELLPLSPQFKLPAYLAASLSFHPSSTPVLPLATHQLRKDLTSPSSAAVSAALHLLSSASSSDLAADLAPALAPLLSSSNHSLRRKAVAASVPTLALSPNSAPVLLPSLLSSLSDPTAASAICELSAIDPAPYLPLAPDLHQALSTHPANNWTLIKILKILSRLAPLEPRLTPRFLSPILSLLRRPSLAKSLLFELIRTAFSILAHHHEAVHLALDHVHNDFLSSDDPNLKFLGLRALAMLHPMHSSAVEGNRDLVIRSLADADPNIRREALGLVANMVTEGNVVEISELLVKFAARSDPEFCDEVLGAVLSTCGRNVYELVVDFDWYVSLLGDVARMLHCCRGMEIERQLVDIGMRVRDARPELVRVARDLLIDPALLGNSLMCRVLSAAAWVSGEYVEFSRNPTELVEALMQPRTNLLPTMVRAVYIQAVFKALVFCSTYCIDRIKAARLEHLGNSSSRRASCGKNEDDDSESEDDSVEPRKPTSLLGLSEKKEFFTLESLTYVVDLVEHAVAPLMECDQVEVQERARNVFGLIRMLRKDHVWIFEQEEFDKDTRISKMQSLFSEEIGPVSEHAQLKVPVPDGLVLRENLADLATILGDDDTVQSHSISFSLRSHHRRESKSDAASSVESSSLLADHRKRHGLYYLPTEKDETESNEYPLANETQPLIGHVDDATEDLIKLTEKSLIPRKVKHTKSRPTVVRLEDGDSPSTSALKLVKESKYDLLSSAIRDVLLGNEREKSTSQREPSDIPSRRRGKEASTNTESNRNSNLGEKEHGSSSSRRSKHHNRSKERHKTAKRDEEKEETSQKNSSRSDHHLGKHKHRQTDFSLNVVPQAPVIQDFLL